MVEFALIAPTLCLFLIGAFDISHTLYMQSVLQGAVQKAARDGTLESASGSDSTPRDLLDEMVREQLLPLNKNAQINFNRRFYRTFSEAAAAKAEKFTDSASPSLYHDGKCNNGEAYEDANNNGRFDRDGGDSADRAGARDNIVYTVTVSYPRLFPLDRLIGGNGTTTLNASTVLASQPYGDQDRYSPMTIRHCGTGTPGSDAPVADVP
ncbi:MAG TPA: TadE family protein [Sphingobium sp.]|nr:TadE family protein [Sphingobium sp.]